MITEQAWADFRQFIEPNKEYCNFLDWIPQNVPFPKYCYVKVHGDVDAMVNFSDLEKYKVSFNPNNPKNTYIWYKIVSIDDENKRIMAECISSTQQDISKTQQYIDEHETGEVLLNIPIHIRSSEDSKELFLFLSPGVTIYMRKNKEYKFYKNQDGTVNVKISGLNKEKNKIYIKILDYYSKDALLEKLKECKFGEPIITDKYRELFSKLVDINQITDDISNFDINNYSMILYNNALKNEEVMSDVRQERITLILHPIINNKIDKSKLIYDKNNSPVCIGLNVNYEKNEVLFKFVGGSSMFAQQAIEIYTNIDLQRATEGLKEMVLPGESWDYPNREKNYILSQYLRFSYYKALIDKNISYSNNNLNMIFNTGLVNGLYEEIFCLFNRNSTNDKWNFDCFCTAIDANGVRTIKNFGSLPPKNQFIKDFDDIFYKTEIPLAKNFTHILEQNLKRFDINYLKFAFFGRQGDFTQLFNRYRQTQNVREKKQIFNQIIDVINSNPSMKSQIYEDFKHSVQLAIKRCDWNYKTAVPIYFAVENRVTLLLPLAFSVGYNEMKKNDSLALVVAKEQDENGNDVYIGKTILTLEQAYLDARLICRPNSDWLIASAKAKSQDNDYELENEF